jgi:mono/diheme cytochrome c family protein
LAGKWGEEAMVKFLTTGINPEGEKAMPPMPAFRLNPRDARAVFLYLKSLPGPEAGKEKAKGSG